MEYLHAVRVCMEYACVLRACPRACVTVGALLCCDDRRVGMFVRCVNAFYVCACVCGCGSSPLFTVSLCLLGTVRMFVQMGLPVTLNLHDASGVNNWDAMFPDLIEYLGLPSTTTTVRLFLFSPV